MESPMPTPIQDESTVKKEEPTTSNDVEMTDAPEAEAEAAAAKPDTKVTEIAPEPVGSLATAHGVTKDGYTVMNEVVHKLSEYRTEDGYDISQLFQRMLNKRFLPDYFEVIKEPTAFSTVRQKILKKQYKNFREFVRDFALISHNAQVYNRPSAAAYHDAIALRELFKKEMQQLVDGKVLTAEEVELPDLGELPPVEDSPPPGPEDEEQEDDDEDDEEDDEEDDSDDDGAKRKYKRKNRRSSMNRRDGGDETVKEPEEQKKRGRPPKVHTPMEARINNILKGLRKFKNPRGELKIAPFERLPDKTNMPEYYQEVKAPMAMDLIKRQAKRKKYETVGEVLKDIELMFDNAKAFNEEDSEVYNDAVFLQNEARALAEHEKNRPDEDFASEDGRIPLKEILYKGEVWKVGDWIHIINLNDVTKPVVGQIYRTWRDIEGQDWINACWYLRPEQTVHRYDKHFYENEVVKTGRYIDHKIDDVVDRCFVMFFTRYFKGRPRNFPADKEIYVCEARYNEHAFKLNKIKTWASCVPDEVREKDYEMDLFDTPRPMKKFPSPIKHLLRDDATEHDETPKPTLGVKGAPPIVGAVHKLPRAENDSPPPSPTPPLTSPLPNPEPIRPPPPTDRPRFDSQGDISMTGTTPSATASPMISQHSTQPSYTQSFAQARPSASPAPPQHTHSYSSHGTAPVVPPTPSYQASTYNHHTTTTPTATHHHSNPLANYQSYHSSSTPRVGGASSNSHVSHGNAYNPPRAIEVYTLPDAANSSIPADVRSQFHTDEFGRIIFYTSPPMDYNPIPDESQGLGHSLKYLANKVRRKEELEKKRKNREVELEIEAKERLKRTKAEAEVRKQAVLDTQVKSIKIWTENLEKGTGVLSKQLNNGL
ncbi:271e07f5-cccd-47fe-956c-933b6659c509 [Sclerotinia trifoliorum]|uniref:271e07f5-cccd-47fe-956c-933b6659c509 n=1 Tax=Sclerotinia trifoliorum TaxID=28548 RepID=A0A8H2W6N6_9HELO|nr:271e07f5-cccd-47fe-956c-933b6659c509 [Sclerotinia trifoliorum]